MAWWRRAARCDEDPALGHSCCSCWPAPLTVRGNQGRLEMAAAGGAGRRPAQWRGRADQSIARSAPLGAAAPLPRGASPSRPDVGQAAPKARRRPILTMDHRPQHCRGGLRSPVAVPAPWRAGVGGGYFTVKAISVRVWLPPASMASTSALYSMPRWRNSAGTARRRALAGRSTLSTRRGSSRVTTTW
jgi:hypothetical protein